MSSAAAAGLLLSVGPSSGTLGFCRGRCRGLLRRQPLFVHRYSSSASGIISCVRRLNEQLLVVVGGGAAGVYAAITAKSISPSLDVLVIEKGKLLSKVKISGGGRCNVTNGHCVEKMALAENYPRGSKELRGSFFDIHGPLDTISWFSQHGVELKTEEDGRVFPVSNSSSSVVDCLLHEAKRAGVMLQTGKTVTKASTTSKGNFLLTIEKQSADSIETIEADFVLLATGSSCQATFTKVKAKLKPQTNFRNSLKLSQIGSMLVTHWGLSGPVILRLSAWGARDLAESDYKGTLSVDFVPDIHVEDVKYILIQCKEKIGKQKVINFLPSQFGLVRRFWRYLLQREGLDEDILWSSLSNNSIHSLALLLKQCPFTVIGKGQFKDEFVTAGGVPLSEISLSTMESRLKHQLFFAGEVLNVDGVTGGFNFQNAWSGGYIAGNSIGLASIALSKMEPSG